MGLGVFRSTNRRFSGYLGEKFPFFVCCRRMTTGQVIWMGQSMTKLEMGWRMSQIELTCCALNKIDELKCVLLWGSWVIWFSIYIYPLTRKHIWRSLTYLHCGFLGSYEMISWLSLAEASADFFFTIGWFLKMVRFQILTPLVYTIDIYIYFQTYIYMYTFIHTYPYICMCEITMLFTYIYIQWYIWSYMYPHIYLHVCNHTCTSNTLHGSICLSNVSTSHHSPTRLALLEANCRKRSCGEISDIPPLKTNMEPENDGF